ncbi:Protein of unknown function [Bacillus cereus]|nr:Protein of unknown function [Bacillus cereus]
MKLLFKGGVTLAKKAKGHMWIL